MEGAFVARHLHGSLCPPTFWSMLQPVKLMAGLRDKSEQRLAVLPWMDSQPQRVICPDTSSKPRSVSFSLAYAIKAAIKHLGPWIHHLAIRAVKNLPSCVPFQANCQPILPRG